MVWIIIKITKQSWKESWYLIRSRAKLNIAVHFMQSAREFVVPGIIICTSVKRTKESNLAMNKVDVFNEF